METPKNYDYDALDDIGFAGDPDYNWTEEDSAFVRQCFADHKIKNTENVLQMFPETQFAI